MYGYEKGAKESAHTHEELSPPNREGEGAEMAAANHHRSPAFRHHSNADVEKSNAGRFTHWRNIWIVQLRRTRLRRIGRQKIRGGTIAAVRGLSRNAPTA